MTREEGEKFRIFSIAKRFFASFLFACVLVAIGYNGLSFARASATPPRILMYQGRLLNSNSVPVADATASMSFALYDALSGGTCLWSNNSSSCASVVARTVTLSAGLFSEALGDTGASYAAILATVFSDNATIYLEVTVNGETLSPRKQMLASPYALNTDSLDGYNTTLIGSTTFGVPVFNSNGNLVITGAPQGTGLPDGSLYINPATGDVAANEIIFGVAVSDGGKFSVDAEGDTQVYGNIDANGSGTFGSITGNGIFDFTSIATTTDGMGLVLDSLTSGNGLVILRNDDGGATAATGRLLSVEQSDVTASTGIALSVVQAAAGNSVAGYFVQTNVADQTNGAGGTTVGGQALVLETSEAASNDDIMLIRSNGQVVLAIETDGSVLSDSAYSAAGADYAEYFPATDGTLGAREMACQDGSRPLSVRRCSIGDQKIVGVISSNPGFIGNLPDNGETGNVLVGMVGQIETLVNANESVIAIGDPISTSMTMAGYGAKARGPVRIIGFALESLSAGTGTIRVLVQPQWYGGDVLTHSGSATQVTGSLAVVAATAATSAASAINSADLQFRGSAWNGSAAETRSISLRTTVSAGDDYRLSVMNNDGIEVASINHSGDFALAGKFYPSDRGAVQSSAYIYYDGSAGIGGSFMRTNASGWATGSYDFAEMFPSSDVLQPGEVVSFGDQSQYVKRSTGETYSGAVVGIVSTKPGFLAGENRAGSYPIALAGRVPTFVSSENGEIKIGDPLTTSSTPGYAMKATAAGPILGYAAEAFTGVHGKIIVYVNVSYYAGTPVKMGPATENTISHLVQDIENFDTTGVLNFNGGSLLAIGSMMSSSGAWRLNSNGDFITSGRFVQLVTSATGEQIETYAATSREMMVQLSGTASLERGRATVRFADIDSQFASIIDSNATYRALVTPYGATGPLYVTNRTIDGFDVVESGMASSGIDVDWIVLAYRRDYAPIADIIVTPQTIPVLPPESIQESSGGASASGGDAMQDGQETPSIDLGVSLEEPVVIDVIDQVDATDEILNQESALSDNVVAPPVDSEESSGIDAPVEAGNVDVPEPAVVLPESAPAPVVESPAAPAESAPSTGGSDAGTL